MSSVNRLSTIIYSMYYALSINTDNTYSHNNIIMTSRVLNEKCYTIINFIEEII